ncbi:MAG: hypothetical protein KDA41_05740 [Planctomycetales bacterium]|nr:hypothetical protein [Planctomycetales bacterium]
MLCGVALAWFVFMNTMRNSQERYRSPFHRERGRPSMPPGEQDPPWLNDRIEELDGPDAPRGD